MDKKIRGGLNFEFHVALHTCSQHCTLFPAWPGRATLVTGCVLRAELTHWNVSVYISYNISNYVKSALNTMKEFSSPTNRWHILTHSLNAHLRHDYVNGFKSNRAKVTNVRVPISKL